MLTPSPLFALVLFLFGTPAIAVASDITFDTPTNGTTWNVGLSPRFNVSWYEFTQDSPQHVLTSSPQAYRRRSIAQVPIFTSASLVPSCGGESSLTGRTWSEMWDSIDPGWTQTEINLPALLHSEIDKYYMHRACPAATCGRKKRHILYCAGPDR
ncbi:hypothetical protein K466DRAFT_655476 [Polyporus arcularius HHB13444]|uniref:Uncharacterized protein n=1 Tax=Polyporus arcularius HHB13444 TaxID=1314778 RepID=A0A5C3P2V1_9APHY|nr:hypothetical protein K466DRAFT_655476 [Polyporus arcularius HHB13444]